MDAWMTADSLYVSTSNNLVAHLNHCRSSLTRWTIFNGSATLPDHFLYTNQNEFSKTKLDNVSVLYKTPQWLPNALQFSSVQLLSPVRLFATPWIAASQAFLSITNSRSSLRLTSIESVMPSSHLILSRPLLLLPPIPPSIRVFSNESTLRMSGQSTGVSALASVLPKNTQDWSPLEWTGWISLQSKALSRVFSNSTVQKHQFFGAQLSSQSNFHIHTWPLEKS